MVSYDGLEGFPRAGGSPPPDQDDWKDVVLACAPVWAPVDKQRSRVISRLLRAVSLLELILAGVHVRVLVLF